jgi:hypothetical protein
VDRRAAALAICVLRDRDSRALNAANGSNPLVDGRGDWRRQKSRTVSPLLLSSADARERKNVGSGPRLATHPGATQAQRELAVIEEISARCSRLTKPVALPLIVAGLVSGVPIYLYLRALFFQALGAHWPS